MSTNSDDHTLVKQNCQEVEVDYADPESPTQRDPPSISAVADIDRTAIIDTDDTVQQLGRQIKPTDADTGQP